MDEATIQNLWKQYGDEWMALSFDDEKKSKKHKTKHIKAEEEDVAIEQSTTSTSQPSASSSISAAKPTASNVKQPKVTKFQEVYGDFESLPHHNSLDDTSQTKKVAIGKREEKELKQQMRKMREIEAQKSKEEIKKIKKGENLDIHSNEKIAKKTEEAKEKDKLMFEMRKMIMNPKTGLNSNQKEYERFLEDENMKQGKQFKTIKQDYKNYKILKQDKMKQRQEQITNSLESMQMGLNIKSSYRKEQDKLGYKQKQKVIRDMERWGAPNDIGKTDFRLKHVRKRMKESGVGVWKGSALFLNAGEVKHKILKS